MNAIFDITDVLRLLKPVWSQDNQQKLTTNSTEGVLTSSNLVVT